GCHRVMADEDAYTGRWRAELVDHLALESIDDRASLTSRQRLEERQSQQDPRSPKHVAGDQSRPRATRAIASSGDIAQRSAVSPACRCSRNTASFPLPIWRTVARKSLISVSTFARRSLAFARPSRSSDSKRASRSFVVATPSRICFRTSSVRLATSA